MIRAALGQADPIIFGTDYPTEDGTAVRDYIHVADLAEAHIRAVAYLAALGKSVTLNLGTGTGHSVRKVISGVERLSGRLVPQRESPRRPGDPPELIADPGIAAMTLGLAGGPIRSRYDHPHSIDVAYQSPARARFCCGQPMTGKKPCEGGGGAELRRLRVVPKSITIRDCPLKSRSKGNPYEHPDSNAQSYRNHHAGQQWALRTNEFDRYCSARAKVVDC